MMDKLNRGLAFMKEKHRNQVDDEGQPYWKHCLQVGLILQCIRKRMDDDLMIAGFLHDTLEDTNTTYEELVKEFGTRVADLVKEVTHEGNKKTGYYFPNLKSKDAILIKFADRLSNLSRMEGWDKDRQQHYLNKSKFWKDVYIPQKTKCGLQVHHVGQGRCKQPIVQIVTDVKNDTSQLFRVEDSKAIYMGKKDLTYEL